jgi:hypothetical protein
VLTTGTCSCACGPLKKHPQNPRYFAAARGHAVYLTGSHTWNVLQDFSPGPVFDYDRYLRFMTAHGYNFFRMWSFEHPCGVMWADTNTAFSMSPLPFARTGPGLAADGKPKFDLTQFNPDYFQRLRERTAAAYEAGLYVSVMLFQGFSVEHYGRQNPFRVHPMHRDNNINGIHGDPHAVGDGKLCHTLEIPGILAIQEAYVRKVIETVGDLPSVLYEISNESSAHSTAWQYHMIQMIQACERQRPLQHPVGMSYQWEGGTNEALLRSPADFICPNPEGGYGGADPDPFAHYLGKVIIPDTDHLWGIGGSRGWVWRCFLRGLNPIFMDPYDGGLIRADGTGQWQKVPTDEVRAAMTHTATFARRMNLAEAQPAGQICSSRFCLAEPGRRYLAYQCQSGKMQLRIPSGHYEVEWFDPVSGHNVETKSMKVDTDLTAFDPSLEGEAVLFLQRRG